MHFIHEICSKIKTWIYFICCTTKNLKLEFQKKTYIDALELKFWFQFCLERIENLDSLETFSIFTSTTIHLDVKGKQPTKTQNMDVKGQVFLGN